jgi:sialidase-1
MHMVAHKSLRRLRIGAAALAASALAVASAPAPASASPHPDAGHIDRPSYVEQDLAVNGVGGFPNYRIPALTVTSDGDLLASYDGRPTAKDAPGPNFILQRRSVDGGATWQPQEVVRAGQVEAPIKGYSDPSYIVDRSTGHIFNFHVYSQRQGFVGSQPGVDPADPNVLHAELSTSTDGGRTWTHRTITADITPDLSWRSRFAASGQGIQLRYGPHAGRLIQQFTIINGQGHFQAVSVYSDDHGRSWRAGQPVGIGMDENKTVELSDGRVMLNSRDSQRSGFRKVAISEDGGVTYGEVHLDRQLPDPTNNASIIRAYPDAPQGSARAKMLLFSNAANSTSRRNGTVRMSCDDGRTWPIAKVFQPGSMSYSTLATLPDGTVGLLYEPGTGIRFATFDLAWLDGVCAPLHIGRAELRHGTNEVEVVIENQAGRALPKATLDLRLPEGWTAEPVHLPVLLPHRSATVTVRVTVPESAGTGSHNLTAVLTTPQGTASRATSVSVSR